MVRRACLFEKPKNTASTTATVTSTTTAYRSKKNQAKANDEAFIEKDVDQVLVEPVVVSEATYPNLVSIINQTNLLKICTKKWMNGVQFKSNQIKSNQIKLKFIYLAKG